MVNIAPYNFLVNDMQAEMFAKSLLRFATHFEMLNHEKDWCMDRGTDSWTDM